MSASVDWRCIARRSLLAMHRRQDGGNRRSNGVLSPQVGIGPISHLPGFALVSEFLENGFVRPDKNEFVSNFFDGSAVC
ncbi:hypothetical protein LCGC14_0238530 [marine sediment metagenome]|uniref:Uncharacterized protein n=1 Tax=marine sediment metagenome TaxID=412755 RepID=A0A0F9UPV1_9ZZZZ